MNAFKDPNGKLWQVPVNVTTLKRVKSVLDIDLMGIVSQDSTVLTTLYEDPIEMVNVIYVLCKDQADEMGLSDEDFGQLFASGDLIEEAATSLIEGLTDFFPPRRRAILKKVIQKINQVEDSLTAKAEEMVEAVDVDLILEKAYQQRESGTQFTPAVQS